MKKKKNVLIDLDRLKNPFNGLGQFALQYGKYLAQQKHEDIQFTFLVPCKYVGYFGKQVEYEVTDWRRRYFSWWMKSYDLWHAVHQDSNFFPRNSQTLYLLTIHDLNFLKEKSTYKAQKRLKRLQKKVERSIRVTTISEYSKNEILKNLKISLPIEVIYNGIEVSEPRNLVTSYYLGSHKFILGIGVIHPKKNWQVLLPFIKRLPSEYLLVLAGDDQTDYAQKLKEQARREGLENRIQWLGRVSEEQKFYLLRDCYAFVFPSKLEGMGMPPLEAMRFGKPVFVFPNASIPEFCKDFAYYWSTEEPQNMADFFIEKVNEFYHNPLKAQKVKDYSLQFNWQTTVNEFVKLYRELLNLKNSI